MSDYLASLVTRARESQTAIRPASSRQLESAPLANGASAEDQASPVAPPITSPPPLPVMPRSIRESARVEASAAEQRFDKTDAVVASAQSDAGHSPAKAAASGIASNAAFTPIESTDSTEPMSLRGSVPAGQAVAGVAGRDTVPRPTGKSGRLLKSAELPSRQPHRTGATGFPVRPVAHQVRVAEESSLPLAAEPVPPAIHVTIGRVEVRATVTNPEPRARGPQTSPKVVSLEEHLRRRVGGGGR